MTILTVDAVHRKLSGAANHRIGIEIAGTSRLTCLNVIELSHRLVLFEDGKSTRKTQRPTKKPRKL